MKSPSRFLALAGLLALLVLSANGKDAAKLNFLAPDAVNPGALLAPPPAPGSDEQAADMESVRFVYRHASEADKQAAYAEKKYSVFNFAAVAGPFFTATNLPATAAFFKQVEHDVETIKDTAKDMFARPRPFVTDTNLANGYKLETSTGYPSGHSTGGMAMGLILADLMPEHRDAILAHARLMGWHRVQIARHYPTDTYAGRVLAQAIVEKLKKSPKFQSHFAAVKAEIAAAQK
jgi:acid phosphatase (class A)